MVLTGSAEPKALRYESDMIAPIKACLAGRWDDGVVIEELGVGYGVADVVAARPSREGVRRRLRLGQTASLPRRVEVQVLCSMRGIETTRFEELLGLTGISPKRLRYEILRFLLAENYVEEVEEDTFQLCGDYGPVFREIWAVEAKMKNWFEGLCQARRYQHFAHKVFLAIAEARRDRVRDEILREHNVGLITVSHGAADILFQPRRQAPRSEELFLLTNERIWEQIQTSA
jgi:hypothetical protein